MPERIQYQIWNCEKLGKKFSGLQFVRRDIPPLIWTNWWIYVFVLFCECSVAYAVKQFLQRFLHLYN